MILVTGATGFVGSRLCRRLAGRPLRGLVRGGSRAPAGTAAVVGDLTDPSTLPAALEGVDTVVHAAAITANQKEPYRGAYDRINRAGTENLVRAAAAAGAARVVVVSGLGTRPAPAGSYMATRWGMEEAVRGSGLAHVILQPSVMFGAGAEFVGALARLVRASPAVPVLGPPGLRFQPLWIEDLVTCVERCLEDRSLDGRAIPIGGAEYLTMRQIVQAICQALGVRRILVPLPLPAARVQARLLASALSRPPLTPAALELFGFDNATDLDAVERSFGFRPRGLRAHLGEVGLEG